MKIKLILTIAIASLALSACGVDDTTAEHVGNLKPYPVTIECDNYVATLVIAADRPSEIQSVSVASADDLNPLWLAVGNGAKIDRIKIGLENNNMTEIVPLTDTLTTKNNVYIIGLHDSAKYSAINKLPIPYC